MPKTKNNISSNEQHKNLFDKGVQIIASAFNEQENYYSQKILELNNEITNLKEENILYKTKLSDLQIKIKALSKNIRQIDIDNIESSPNSLEKNSNNSNIDSSFQKTTINNGNNNITINNENINNINNNQKLYNTFKSNIYKNTLLEPKNNYNHINTNYDYNSSLNINNLEENQRINSFPYYINNEYDKDALNNLKTIRDNSHSNNTKNFYLNNRESKSSHNFKKKRIFTQKYFKNSQNYTKNNYDSKERESDNFGKQLKFTDDKNSKLYKKLNEFLTECKKKLTAEEYDKMIDLLKAYEKDSNFDVRKKVNKIISSNLKLVRLFEDIFES